MRERLFIVGSLGVLLALLVGLNAASFVRVEREPELEGAPDRSTYNAGPTGTRALYEYLGETGRAVLRWREPVAGLLDAQRGQRPQTFVITGRLRVPYTAEEATQLLQWVAAGGRLVVIDRTPPVLLLPPAGDVQLNATVTNWPAADARADKVDDVTANRKPLAPTQPTLLTRDVTLVAPSRYVSHLVLNPVRPDAPTIEGTAAAAATAAPQSDEDEDEAAPAATETAPTAPPPPPRPTPAAAKSAQPGADVADAAPPPTAAPVWHIADEQGALLADYVHGRGRIIVLTDPFIVANNGIERADNLQLARNLVAGQAGPVAFDEYHQGRGVTHNQLLSYFAGTPVLALCGQAALMALVALWTRGRRFARPLPAPHADRRSKLEFVASMAELQQRARAYDLAVENIYARTRRALARYGGIGPDAPRATLAARAAHRSGLDPVPLEALLRDCEEVVNGTPTSARQALALVARLRLLEARLGIRMRTREIKQAERL